MPMLGDLLAAARRSAGSFHDRLGRADPELAERVGRAAEAMGLGTGTYVRMAIADFSRFASEEDWATLTSALRDTADPGTTCLLAMIDWRLTAAACGSHSHSHHDGEAADERRRHA